MKRCTYCLMLLLVLSAQYLATCSSANISAADLLSDVGILISDFGTPCEPCTCKDTFVTEDLKKAWHELSKAANCPSSGLSQCMRPWDEQCGLPPSVKNTDFIMDSNVTCNRTAKYSCKIGYANVGGNITNTACVNDIWSQLDLRCTDYIDCYAPSGGRAIYGGKLNTTKSGLTCQRWDSQQPRSHSMKDDYFQTTNGFAPETLQSAANYCRDPDRTGKPWCYATTSVRWEFCDIPTC